jgi:hypothetical protein
LPHAFCLFPDVFGAKGGGEGLGLERWEH